MLHREYVDELKYASFYKKLTVLPEYVNVFFKILFLDMVPLASASIKRILIGICRFELFRLVMACDT